MIKRTSEIHRFFCLACGKEGIPIGRKLSLQKGREHRKRMYCPWCKVEVNHIECRNDFEVEDFKRRFENGEFVKEAEESLNYIQEEAQTYERSK